MKISGSRKNVEHPSLLRVRTRLKRYKRTASRIESLPNELIGEVMTRLATSSYTDFINAELSCKTFREIGENTNVYHHVFLEKKYLDPWTRPLSEEQQAFLKKCWESENPELFYRQGVLDYFNGVDIGSACIRLVKAMDSRHVGALYVACIMLILADDDQLKRKGVELISSMQKSSWMRQKLDLCRKNLMESVSRMWVNNPLLKRRPVFCKTRHEDHWASGWRDIDRYLQCQACCADREISVVCGLL